MMRYTSIGVDMIKHLMQVHYADPHSGELTELIKQ